MPEPAGPGYTTDPYKDEGDAPFFLGTMFAGLTGDADGFISTYREWHIMLAGIGAGLRAKTFENVPECPPLWEDEKQYWDVPAMVANVVKCQWPTVATVISGYLLLSPNVPVALGIV